MVSNSEVWLLNSIADLSCYHWLSSRYVVHSMYMLMDCNYWWRLFERLFIREKSLPRLLVWQNLLVDLQQTVSLLVTICWGALIRRSSHHRICVTATVEHTVCTVDGYPTRQSKDGYSSIVAINLSIRSVYFLSMEWHCQPSWGLIWPFAKCRAL